MDSIRFKFKPSPRNSIKAVNFSDNIIQSDLNICTTKNIKNAEAEEKPVSLLLYHISRRQ